MDKKVIWFIVVLAILVVFFSSLIIIMERLTTKPAGIISTKDIRTNEQSSISGRNKYDVFKPKKEIEKKQDFWNAPNLEYKFSGKEPVIDI